MLIRKARSNRLDAISRALMRPREISVHLGDQFAIRRNPAINPIRGHPEMLRNYYVIALRENTDLRGREASHEEGMETI